MHLSCRRQWIIIPAVVACCLATAGTASAATGCDIVGLSNNHTDVQGCTLYYPAIDWLYKENIAEGSPTATKGTRVFLPENPINRAEFTKLVLLSNTTLSGGVLPALPPCTEDPFPDVPKDAWFAPYVCSAKTQNIIEGFPDGTFGPERDINFAEAAKILARTFNVPVTRSDTRFDDTQEVWYRPFTLGLLRKNAIAPSIQSFAARVTRGEMAEMLYRLKTGKTSFGSGSLMRPAGLGLGYVQAHAEEALGLSVDPPDPPHIFTPVTTLFLDENNPLRGYAFRHVLPQESCGESGLWEHCTPLRLRWSIEFYRPNKSVTALLQQLDATGLDRLPIGYIFGGRPGYCYFHSFEGDYGEYCIVEFPGKDPLFVMYRGYSGTLGISDPNPNAEAAFARVRKSMKFTE